MQWVLLWASILLLLFLPIVQVILSQATLLHTHRQLVDFLGKLPFGLTEEEVEVLLAASGFDEGIVRLLSMEGAAYRLEYVCPLTRRTRALKVRGAD